MDTRNCYYSITDWMSVSIYEDGCSIFVLSPFHVLCFACKVEGTAVHMHLAIGLALQLQRVESCSNCVQHGHNHKR